MRITIRLTPSDIKAIEIIKSINHSDSATDAIRFALGELLKSKPTTEEFMRTYNPSVPIKEKLDKIFSPEIETPIPKDENPYLLVSKGWNHELGEGTKLIKQNLKPWLSRELLESDPDFPFYTVVGKPAQGEVDDIQTI